MLSENLCSRFVLGRVESSSFWLVLCQKYIFWLDRPLNGFVGRITWCEGVKKSRREGVKQ